MKILALDVGSKRVGLAIAVGPTGPVTPLEALPRAGGRAERAIIDLIARESISTLIAGLPLHEDGSRSEGCDQIEAFCRRIARRTGVSVEFVDEYGSSAEAEELLRAQGALTSTDRRRGRIDSAAAAILVMRFRELKNA